MQAQFVALATGSMLSKSREILLTSKAKTEPIYTTDKGHSCLSSNDWNDVIDRAQINKSHLTRDQVEFNLLRMCCKAVPSRIKMKLPNDSEVDVVQPLSNEPKVDDVPGNMDDLSSNEAEKTLC